MSEDDRGPGRIDGWLLVFLALIGGLTPLVYLVVFCIGRIKTGVMEDRFGPEPIELTITSWVLGIAQIAIPLFILWRMLARKEWRSVQIAAAGVWLLFVGLPLIDYLLALRWGGGPPDFFLRYVMPVLARGTFFAFSASWYLLASKRVTRTYPRDPDIARIFE